MFFLFTHFILELDMSKMDVQDQKGRNLLILDVPLNELKISTVYLVEKGFDYVLIFYSSYLLLLCCLFSGEWF
jgi:hypothetical protein